MIKYLVPLSHIRSKKASTVLTKFIGDVNALALHDNRIPEESKRFLKPVVRPQSIPHLTLRLDEGYSAA